MIPIRRLFFLVLLLITASPGFSADGKWLTKTIKLTSVDSGKTALITLKVDKTFSISDPKGLFPADMGSWYDSVFKTVPAIAFDGKEDDKAMSFRIMGTTSDSLKKGDTGACLIPESPDTTFSWECIGVVADT